MKILSWNIWIDCAFEELKDFLRNSDADIVGLQEVKDTDPEREVIDFMSSLGYEYFFTPTEQIWDQKVWRHGPAVFSKYPITHAEKIQLAEGDNERAAAYVQVSLNGNIIHVFSTHLIHTHQKPSAEQEAQASILLKRVPKEKGVIVMGDFNAEPDSVAVKMMKERLVDSDKLSQPTWSVFTDGCKTCNLGEKKVRLDYIFLSPDIKVTSFEVGDSRASDHLPIVAEVEL